MGAFVTLLVWRFFDHQHDVSAPADGALRLLRRVRAVLHAQSRVRVAQGANSEEPSGISRTWSRRPSRRAWRSIGARVCGRRRYRAAGEEIKEALSEIRLGRARADALKAVGERTNHPALRNALRVMTQAERLGANIAKMLNELAQDARHQRLMMVEEIAAKLPVKMVFPMVFFMIPAIVTIIFGAVAANYFAGKP